jgi:small subunit ribosomal protein S16
MLAIRLQRTGRKGHAEFRVIVQEAQVHPSSGRVVATIGTYNPHSKAVTLDKEKAAHYVQNGAQPSPRVVLLLEKEGVKLPDWVQKPEHKQAAIKNGDKLRRNKPVEEAAPEVAEPTEEATASGEAAPAEPATAETETPTEA